MVEDINERNASFLLRGYQLEIANGELVKPNIFVFIDPRYGRDVRSVFVFSVFQIVQDRARCNDRFAESINTKPFQGCRAELVNELFVRIVEGINPFIQCEGIVLVSEKFFEAIAGRFAEYDFRGRESLDQLNYVALVALRSIVFTGGYVEKRF